MRQKVDPRSRHCTMARGVEAKQNKTADKGCQLGGKVLWWVGLAAPQTE